MTNQYEELLASQRNFYQSGITQDVAFRKKMLRTLDKGLSDYKNALMEALEQDLGKPAYQSFVTEYMMLKEELRHTIPRLTFWAHTKRVCTPIYQFPAKSLIRPQPFGNVLIISPWNYPLLLTIDPLIAAMAAGNTVVVKPSAYSPAVSAVMANMLTELFPKEYIAVIQGGRAENQALLDQKFDYIFFTGSPNVGKTVMEKASANLTPVSLELGGKSPAIVDSTANIKLAARNIAFGKLINSGQTCVAPDYVFVQKSVQEEFIQEVIGIITRFYGEHPLENKEWPKIVNKKHFERLLSLIPSGDIVFGGSFDTAANKIEPTVLKNVSTNSPVMQEEIFGPIMPILSFESIDEPFSYVLSHERPLAAYLFTDSDAIKRRFLKELTFGGGCINNTIMQLANPNLPFGGVGGSGMGSYHGKFGFNTFTHYEGITEYPSNSFVSDIIAHMTKGLLNVVRFKDRYEEAKAQVEAEMEAEK